MTDYTILDSKFSSLTEACMISKNYYKLIVVTLILISNYIDEIGIKLSIRPRKKDNENIFNYMKLINAIFSDNLKIKIFEDDHIEKIKHFETKFHKYESCLTPNFVKDIINLYYEIRKINVPNLHEVMDEDQNFAISSDIRFCSNFLLNKNVNKRKNPESNLKEYILYKINEKQREIENNLRIKGYNKNLLKQALYLKKLKNTTKSEKSGKTIVSGPLKNNLNYQRSINELVGFLLIGISSVLFMIGSAILWLAITFPEYTSILSVLLLVFFFPGFLLVFLYWINFKKY